MLGNKMKRLRLSNKLTLDELATKLNERYPGTVNFNKGKLSKWENGKEEPKLSSMRILSDFYNTSIDSFYDEDLEEKQLPNTLTLLTETTAKLEEQRQTKVLTYAQEQLEEQEQANDKVIQFPSKCDFDWRGFVSAGTGEYLDGEMKETIQLTEDEIPYRADFALTVNGDSMKPLFKDHETIFVEETTEILNGAIGVVLIDDEAFVKKIYTYRDGMTLVSLNSEYDDIEIRDNKRVKIIGRVVM
jgi:repressor LexA